MQTFIFYSYYHNFIITIIKWFHYLAQRCVYFWSVRSRFDWKSERKLNAICGIRRNPGNWIIIVCPFWSSRVSDSDDWSGNNSCKSCAFPRTIDVAAERINIGTVENHSAAIADRSSKTRGSLTCYTFFFCERAKPTYVGWLT